MFITTHPHHSPVGYEKTPKPNLRSIDLFNFPLPNQVLSNTPSNQCKGIERSSYLWKCNSTAVVELRPIKWDETIARETHSWVGDIPWEEGFCEMDDVCFIGSSLHWTIYRVRAETLVTWGPSEYQASTESVHTFWDIPHTNSQAERRRRLWPYSVQSVGAA